MKTICSIVMNTLNNDSRVLRIGKCLSQIASLKYIAYSDKVILRRFINDTIFGIPIIRIHHLTKNAVKKINQNSLLNTKNTYNSNNLLSQGFHIIKDLIWKLREIHRLFKVLILEKYDIYYCNDFNTLISGYLASRRKRAKLVYDSHELWSERNGSRSTTFNRINRVIEYFIEWFLIKRCNIVITVSNGIANELVKRYKMKKPLIIRNLDEITPLPSLENRMRIRDKLNIPHDCILIVYQGSLHKNRGIPELVKAMDTLPQHIHLLLMGKFISKKELIEVKSNPRIYFPGMIPQEDLFNYTACADIGIAPIRIKELLSHELTFPNKFSQYMNARLALALYNVPESRIIIEKYDCGVVFEPGYSESIINAINSIVDSGKIDYYKNNSRNAFLEEYNWDIEKQKLIDIVKQL